MDDFHELPLSEPGGELLGAMAFLAALAYPESIPARDRAIEAMKALCAKLAIRHGRDCKQPSMRNQQIEGTLRRLSARIEKRLEAADAAAWISIGARQPGPREKANPADMQRARFFVLKAGGRIAASAEEIRRTGRGVLIATLRAKPGALLSVNEFARQSQRGDWERDTWRESRPVLHLALALRGIGMKWTDPRGFGLLPLLASPQWIRDALPSGEEWLATLERSGKKHPALASAGRRVHLMAG